MDAFVAQNIRYNELEMSYIICSIGVLLAGMTFQSGIMNQGTILRYVITYFVAVVLVTAMVVFVMLLTVEIIRSLKAVYKAESMAAKPAGTVTVNAAASLMQYSNSLFMARPGGVPGLPRPPGAPPGALRRPTAYATIALLPRCFRAVHWAVIG